MTNVEDEIMALFPTEQGMYTLGQLQVIRMHVMDLLKELVAAKVIVTRYSLPHLAYYGEQVEVKTEGLARNTKIKVDGKLLNFVRDIRIDAGVEGGVHVTVTIIDLPVPKNPVEPV